MVKDKKEKGKLVVVTGTSGCGGKDIFLPKFENLCRKQEKKLKIYCVGKMIFDWALKNLNIKLRLKTVLSGNPDVLAAYHAAVLNEIGLVLEKDLEENDVVLISLHTCFYWKGTYLPVYNERWIRNLSTKPDLFISFIDNGMDTLDRLLSRDQWKDFNLTEKDIWLWQNQEVNNTKRYLYLYDANEDSKFFVIPIRQRPETLYLLLFEPWRPLVYPQMPISHVTSKELKKATAFIEQLWKWGILFSPLTIETGVVERESANTEIKIRHNQTGFRDVEWFIPQVDICMANYAVAKDIKKVLTIGVPDETAQASLKGKEAWVIFPSDYSPFVEFRATPARIFGSTDEVLKFFPKFCEKWKKEWEERMVKNLNG